MARTIINKHEFNQRIRIPQKSPKNPNPQFHRKSEINQENMKKTYLQCVRDLKNTPKTLLFEAKNQRR